MTSNHHTPSAARLLAQLQRSAVKAGREVREFEWISPEADFPSPDGNPPLKMVLLRV